MTKTPDPNYWGNPPQTPSHTSQETSFQGAPQAPCQQNPQAGPTYSAQQPGSTNAQGAAAPNAQPQQAVPNQQIPQPQAAPYGTPPTPPQKKKHTGCIVAAIIAVILVVLLGVAGCSACSAVISSVEDSRVNHPNFDLPDNNYPSDPIASAGNSYVRDAFGLSANSNASLTADELNTIQADYFANTSKQPDEEGDYPAGVYYIGSDIPAGGYWFDGDDDELSNFYILQPSDNNDGTYDVTHINSYYGHNLTEVQDGEVLIVDNGEEMTPLDQPRETFTPPYESGTYRVGTDIPAGTYQLHLGEVNDYSACYVMKDLNFTEESYLFEAYYIDGDQPDEITLEEGTYVELYNMSMTPMTT